MKSNSTWQAKFWIPVRMSTASGSRCMFIGHLFKWEQRRKSQLSVICLTALVWRQKRANAVILAEVSHCCAALNGKQRTRPALYSVTLIETRLLCLQSARSPGKSERWCECSAPGHRGPAVTARRSLVRTEVPEHGLFRWNEETVGKIKQMTVVRAEIPQDPQPTHRPPTQTQICSVSSSD